MADAESTSPYNLKALQDHTNTKAFPQDSLDNEPDTGGGSGGGGNSLGNSLMQNLSIPGGSDPNTPMSTSTIDSPFARHRNSDQQQYARSMMQDDDDAQENSSNPNMDQDDSGPASLSPALEEDEAMDEDDVDDEDEVDEADEDDDNTNSNNQNNLPSISGQGGMTNSTSGSPLNTPDMMPQLPHDANNALVDQGVPYPPGTMENLQNNVSNQSGLALPVSQPSSYPEGARELSSEVVVGTLKIRVGIRKAVTGMSWPRWAVQCLDVDGSELILDTMDISQPFIGCPRDNKAVTLTRDSTAMPPPGPPPMYDAPPGGPPMPPGMPPGPPMPGGECDCPECKNEQRMMMEDAGMVPDSVMKRRRYDGPDDDGLSDDGGSSCMRVRDHMKPEPGPPPPGYGGPVVYAPPPNTSVECDDPTLVPYMHPQNPRGPGGRYDPVQHNPPPKVSDRIYTEEEKRKLRNVNWPKKIKTNGLPALWCHSCYLDKRMFKIVSPLSPKPSIVYFRHQQCNTSYHKGESLPAHIVKQYQEYYRNRGNRQAAAAAAGQPPQPSLTPPPTRIAPPTYGQNGEQAATDNRRRSNRRDSVEPSSDGGGGSSSEENTNQTASTTPGKDLYGGSGRRQLLG